MADPQQPCPPPCPKPAPLTGFRADGNRRAHRPQPLSRPNAVASITPAVEAQFAAVEVELGGRQKLAALLHAADVPERDLQLAALLADPANDHTSLAQLCTWARVSLRRLLEFVKEAALIGGQTRALVTVGEYLPDVAASLMADAISGERTCPECKGLRTHLDDPTPQNPAPVHRICKTCDGTGVVPYRPETELRKVALQVGRLLEKPGGTTVNIAQRFGPAESYDQVVSRTDAVLFGTGRERLIVDGEANGQDNSDDDHGA
jgi:hypothetical protein